MKNDNIVDIRQYTEKIPPHVDADIIACLPGKGRRVPGCSTLNR